MEELETSARRNRILNALPKSELLHLLPAMERVGVFARQVLDRPGALIEFVQFPLDGGIVLVARSGLSVLLPDRQAMKSSFTA